MIKKINILLFLLFVFQSSLTAKNYSVGDTLNVAAINGLNLRENPSLESKKIKLMSSGSDVLILNTFDFQKSDTIDQLHGNWIFVKSDTEEGYAFDGYLSKLPFAHIEEDIPFCSIVGRISRYTLNHLKSNGCHLNFHNEVDGGDSQQTELIELINGGILKQQVFWESYRIELKLVGVRDSEIFNLMNQITVNCENEDPKIKKELEKIKDLRASVFINKLEEEVAFTINVRRSYLSNVFITIEGGP